MHLKKILILTLIAFTFSMCKSNENNKPENVVPGNLSQSESQLKNSDNKNSETNESEKLQKNETGHNSEDYKNLDAPAVVKLFVESLGHKDFKTAHYLQKVEKWGSYNQFSSTKAFGGITETIINRIEQLPDENEKAVVFIDAFYYDPVNGDNRLEEKFYLEKFDDGWKITDLKVLSLKLNSDE